MKPGCRSRLPDGRIDYKQVRKINPEAARRAVIEYLRTNGHDVSQTAFIFDINRTVLRWKNAGTYGSYHG